MLTKRMGIKKKNIHDYLDTVAIDEGLTNLNWKYTLKQAGLKKYDSKSVVKNINLIIAKTDEYLKKQKEQMETAPCYDEDFTLRGNLTEEKKQQMQQELEDKIGYVD